MFVGLPDPIWAYFVHSFVPESVEGDLGGDKRQEVFSPAAPAPAGGVVGWCDYGGSLVAALEHENVWAVQFHPEKSVSGGVDHGEKLRGGRPREKRPTTTLCATGGIVGYGMVDRIARASGDVWAPAPPVDVMATEPLLRAAIKRTTTPGVDDYKERAVAFATDQGQRHRAALGVLSTHPDLMAEGWWESESGWYRGDVVSLDSPHDEHLVRALAYLGCGRPLGDRFHPSSAAAAYEVAGIAEKMTGGEIATGVLVLAALMLGLRVERGEVGPHLCEASDHQAEATQVWGIAAHKGL